MKFVPLSSVAEIQLGKMLSPKAKTGTAAFPYLRNQNVQWRRFELDDLATMDFSERERAKFELRKGDLLICEGGEPGRCAVWDGSLKNCYYQKALHRVRVKPDAADPDFIALWIQFQALTGAFEDQNAKTTIAHLPLVRLERLLIPNIGRQKQNDIAIQLKAELNAVEHASLAAHRQISEADALLTSIYREAYRRMTPVALPKSRSTPPVGWKWHKLTDFAQLESGHTPSRLRPDWWGGNVSWVSLTEIRGLDGKWVEETQLRTNEAGISNSSARILPRGTVCFSRTASVGFVTIMSKPMATSQDFANWVCGEELDPEFLMYALIRSRSELRSIATGATHKTIYMPELGSLQICAPEHTEQKRIVAALKKQLASEQEMRSALLLQYREIKAMPQRILAQTLEI